MERPRLIVVDVGCRSHNIGDVVDESVRPLIERFKPDELYGFDPYPDTEESDQRVGETRVVLARRAAWTKDGELDYDPRGIGSTVVRDRMHLTGWKRPEQMRVPCFDFASWLLARIRYGERWIVKLDCEGAEFEILEHLMLKGVDRIIAGVLVEWHDHLMDSEFKLRRERIEANIRCPIERW